MGDRLLLHKFNIVLVIITIILVLIKIINPNFEPFSGFIYAWVGLIFILLGVEEFQKDKKFSAFVFSSGGILLLLLVLLQ